MNENTASRPSKQQLKKARQLLHHAKKVYRYRCDLMDASARKDYQQRVESLETKVFATGEQLADAEAIDNAVSELDAIMKKTGGKMYPLGFFAEHTEVFMVAAILALGIRTFFFQPFKIPTNSMYPTYAGTKVHVMEREGEVDLWQRMTERLLYWGSIHEARAPLSGKLEIPLQLVSKAGEEGSYIRGIPHEVKKEAGLFSTTARKYTLYLDGEPVNIELPKNARLGPLLLKSYFPQADDFNDLVQRYETESIGDEQVLIKTDIALEADEPLLRYAVHTGDMLFVDRVSYHFVAPDIGDPFVFRTKAMVDRLHMKQDQYYIKRLVAQGGDKIEIKQHRLYRNGEPETAPIIKKNGERVGKYKGYYALNWFAKRQPMYTQTGDLGPFGKEGVVPENHYFALGDNSRHSSDSRYWGYVPRKSVIGKAAFIFYPFSERWGIAP